MKDRAAWLLSSIGIYSVKYGYQYWKTNHNNTTQVNARKGGVDYGSLIFIIRHVSFYGGSVKIIFMLEF